MDPQILDSIVKFTSYRDSDSLEMSLLMTLSELTNCAGIQLFRCYEHFGEHQISLVLALDHENENDELRWQGGEPVASPPEGLLQALQDEQGVLFRQEERDDLWLAFAIKDHEKACLHISAPSLSHEHQVLLDAFARIYANYNVILQQSERDKLTGLLNRNSLDRRLTGLLEQQEFEHHFGQAATSKRQLSEDDKPWLALLDIDHFKRINDSFGHICGDEVLLKMAQLMSSFFRATDLLFRYGGEEFLIVLEPIPADAAYTKLEAFRQKVSVTDFPLVGNITLSIGFTEASRNEFSQSIIERADRALYFAKDNGRNATYRFESLLQTGALNATSDSGDIDLF